MADVADLVSSSEGVLVCGVLNAKEEDRYLGRENIEPLEVIVDGEVRRIPSFNGWGDLGVSSVVMVNGAEPELYLTTGADLVRLRLNGGAQFERFDILSLCDVHEMTLIDGTLWLANTGYDEAVDFDLRRTKVNRRIKLVWLKAPHTEPIINGEYSVFDGGNQTMNVYDEGWRLQRCVAAAGWGRGADSLGDGQLFCAGNSEKRKRYQQQGGESWGNTVQVFRVTDGECVGHMPISSGIDSD